MPEASPSKWADFVTHTVAQSTGPGTCGSALSVDLADGSLALATVGEEGTRADITWFAGDGQTEVTVEGPSLSGDQVRQLANSIF